ncbi:MAG: hypothetical protein WKG00_25580 [Polyangiaceae bacterium]
MLPRATLAAHLRAAGALLALLLSAADAGAQDPERPAEPAPPPEPAPLPPHPLHRLTYDSTLGLRINPIGIEERLNLFLRRRLSADPSPLWRESSVSVGLTPTLTPSIIRLGPTFEIRPLTILSLSASGYFQSWLKTFKHLQSYPSATAEHSDDDRKAGGEADLDYGTTGAELQLRTQVLAKVGPIVLRGDVNLHRASVDLRDGDRVYYDPRADLLLPNGGWWLVSDTDLVWLTSYGLVAGARFNISNAFLRDRDFAPGEPTEDPNGALMRLGPILAYTFFDEPGAFFNKPTAIVMANWYLAHRYRTGEESSAALPYIALAFRFEGDLYRSD